MKIPIRLQDLLQQDEERIKPFLMLLSQGSASLDCTGVDELTPEQLELIFSALPQEWDFAELGEVISVETLSESLAIQLEQWVLQRQGRSQQLEQVVIEPEEGTSAALDIFNLRDEVITDYRAYIESFLKIRDERVKSFVHKELERGELWPDPLVQLNPSYKKGANVNQLIDQQLLHKDCARYFSTDTGEPFTFYYHQEQAFRTALREEPYVLTTGTGSGKSMTYVVPIFDDLLKHPEIKGVRAILVYPMNALINSQEGEIQKFLEKVTGSPIRIAKYTGQESLTQKTEIQNNPPQILLTNYVMLELMLSRNQEDKLVASSDLKFLILDELHTYRGRQGADVGLLIRKLRQRCGQDFLCIGTSATMSTEGGRSNRQQTVAQVASKLFGVAVKPEHVIDETLVRNTLHPHPTPQDLQRVLDQGIPQVADALAGVGSARNPEHEPTSVFLQHPLAAWIEMTFGLREEEGHLVRRTPISLLTGAVQLADLTQRDPELCLDQIKQMFLWGSKVGGLAFRLHQFISQGGSVYATLESLKQRFLTLEGQYTTTENRLLYPLAFCRECGQDYYLIDYDRERQQVTPRLPTALNSSQEDDDIQAGYLTLDEPGLWDEKEEERLPDTWFRETKREGRKPKKEYARFIPQRLRILPDGSVVETLLEGQTVWFIPKPFLTCLHCGVVHDQRKKEFAKLSQLSSEGRSTATTLLCLSTVNRLKTSGSIPPKAHKILSFTDNRQDASLQAGHFNDFVQTSLLRSALYKAIHRQHKLTHVQLAQAVVDQMGLTQADYAKRRC